MTGRDFELSNQMIEYWTNFAKNGIPSSDHNGLNWKPFTAEERNIMLFGNDSNKMIQI